MNLTQSLRRALRHLLADGRPRTVAELAEAIGTGADTLRLLLRHKWFTLAGQSGVWTLSAVGKGGVV